VSVCDIRGTEMQVWNLVSRAAAFAALVLGVSLTAPAALAAPTCEEILACALDTARGQSPIDICSQCGNGTDTVAEAITKALEDPSITSICGAGNSIAWLQSALNGGLASAVQQTICAINPDSGSIDSIACNRSCEENCGQAAAGIASAAFPRPGEPYDPVRAQEAAHEADKAFAACRAQCGCGWDKIVCEQGAAMMAKFACRAMGLEGQSKPKVAVGESCEEDSDCQNDACGRQTAEKDAAKVCCVSGEAKLYAGYDYCTQMADGARCWSDAQCNSGLCEGNAGGTARGTCAAARKTVGQSCEANKECANDACARESAADGAKKTCCASGDYTTFGGYDYCTKMANGTVCWSDAMCASGNCKGNMSGLQKGVCR